MFVDKFIQNNEVTSGGERSLMYDVGKDVLSREIREARERGGKVIMEIGPGRTGGVALKKDDLYIGVEPYFEGEMSFSTNKAELGARVAVVSDVWQLPQFKPDLFLSIAPNPIDVEENNMLWDYEGYIRDAGVVVVALDMRTREARSGSGVRGFEKKVRSDLQEIGRRRVESEVMSGSISGLMEDLGVDRACNLNSSGDLGGKAIVLSSEK